MSKRIILFVSLFVCAGVCVHAQDAASPKETRGYAVVNGKMHNFRSERLNAPSKRAEGALKRHNAGRKTAFINGVYYKRPDGTLYRAMDKDYSGFYSVDVMAPPFKNMPTKVHSVESLGDVTWELRYLDSSEDVTENYDAEHKVFNMPIVVPPYYIAAPTMKQMVSEFQLGEINMYRLYDPTAYTRYMSAFEMTPLTFVDEHYRLDDVWNSDFIDTGYAFGNGVIEDGGNKYEVYGLQQTYGRLTSPLYVQDVFSQIVSRSKNPIPKGVELVMKVFNPVTGKDYDVLTATADDLIPDAENPYRTDFADKTYFYCLTFSHKVKDEFGNVTVQPFVVDDSVAVSINISQEGVDLGFRGFENPREDALSDALIVVRDGESLSSFNYGMQYGLKLAFTGFMDGIEIIDSLEYNQITFDSSTGMPNKAAFVYTAAPWFGSEYDKDGKLVIHTGGEPFYQFENLPEWVTRAEVDVTRWLSEDVPSLNSIIFACEPLPKGVKSRAARVRIVGRGVTSKQEIILLQGDATGVQAIESGKLDKGTRMTYNLSGQRVSKNYKGVVLVGGKKYVNR
ncbi:MAG: hypothetical protein Q3994_02115 [Prevotella sp.]|nr:hypothetical protein [Prevotella sp.]